MKIAIQTAKIAYPDYERERLLPFAPLSFHTGGAFRFGRFALA
jgi:hypothetical protein